LLRKSLDFFLAGNEAGFESHSFWARYEQRAAFYQGRLQAGPFPGSFGKVVAAFSSNILSRLEDWPALVSHHGAHAAAAVLAGLYGEAG
jgi:hypothetical protein